MDKKTLKYLGFAVILIVIIVIKKNINNFSSNLPELAKWDDKITELSITKNNNNIKVIKKGEKWVVTDRAYPADEKAVQDLINGMKNLKITDFISRKKFYNRFDLNPEKAIVVKVRSGKNLLRNILIGKAGSGGRQAYIKLPDNEAVYLASGNLNRDYNKSIDDLRNKKILEVSSDAIEFLTVKYKGQNYTLVKEKVEATVSGDKDKKDKKSGKAVWVVANNKNLKLNENKVSSFMNGFGNVTADSYPDEKVTANGKSLCILTLKAFNKEISLEIIKRLENNKYLCKSSESDYLFTLNKYKAEGFLKGLKDLK